MWNWDKLYDKIFDNRQKSDYADLVRFEPNHVSHWFGEVKRFVDTIEKLIKKELAGLI